MSLVTQPSVSGVMAEPSQSGAVRNQHSAGCFAIGQGAGSTEAVSSNNQQGSDLDNLAAPSIGGVVSPTHSVRLEALCQQVREARYGTVDFRKFFTSLSEDPQSAELHINAAADKISQVCRLLKSLDDTNRFGALFNTRDDGYWEAVPGAGGCPLLSVSFPRIEGQPAVKFLEYELYRRYAPDKEGAESRGDHSADVDEMAVAVAFAGTSAPSSVWLSPLTEGAALHEYLHSRGKAEFLARRGELDFYRERGVKVLVPGGESDDSILKSIGESPAYSRVQYIEAVLERFGENVAEIRKWLPGGPQAAYVHGKRGEQERNSVEFDLALALLKEYFRSHREEFPYAPMTAKKLTVSLASNSGAYSYAKERLTKIVGDWTELFRVSLLGRFGD